MLTFVDTAWVAERIDSVEILLLDPRRPMKYMQGHLKNAVNLPAYGDFDRFVIDLTALLYPSFEQSAHQVHSISTEMLEYPREQ